MYIKKYINLKLIFKNFEINMILISFVSKKVYNL